MPGKTITRTNRDIRDRRLRDQNPVNKRPIADFAKRHLDRKDEEGRANVATVYGNAEVTSNYDAQKVATGEIGQENIHEKKFTEKKDQNNEAGGTEMVAKGKKDTDERKANNDAFRIIHHSVMTELDRELLTNYTNFDLALAAVDQGNLNQAETQLEAFKNHLNNPKQEVGHGDVNPHTGKITWNDADHTVWNLKDATKGIQFVDIANPYIAEQLNVENALGTNAANRQAAIAGLNTRGKELLIISIAETYHHFYGTGSPTSGQVREALESLPAAADPATRAVTLNNIADPYVRNIVETAVDPTVTYPHGGLLLNMNQEAQNRLHNVPLPAQIPGIRMERTPDPPAPGAAPAPRAAHEMPLIALAPKTYEKSANIIDIDQGAWKFTTGGVIDFERVTKSEVKEGQSEVTFTLDDGRSANIGKVSQFANEQVKTAMGKLRTAADERNRADVEYLLNTLKSGDLQQIKIAFHKVITDARKSTIVTQNIKEVNTTNDDIVPGMAYKRFREIKRGDFSKLFSHGRAEFKEEHKKYNKELRDYASKAKDRNNSHLNYSRIAIEASRFADGYDDNGAPLPAYSGNIHRNRERWDTAFNHAIAGRRDQMLAELRALVQSEITPQEVANIHREYTGYDGPYRLRNLGTRADPVNNNLGIDRKHEDAYEADVRKHLEARAAYENARIEYINRALSTGDPAKIELALYETQTNDSIRRFNEERAKDALTTTFTVGGVQLNDTRIGGQRQEDLDLMIIGDVTKAQLDAVDARIASYSTQVKELHKETSNLPPAEKATKVLAAAKAIGNEEVGRMIADALDRAENGDGDSMDLARRLLDKRADYEKEYEERFLKQFNEYDKLLETRKLMNQFMLRTALINLAANALDSGNLAKGMTETTNRLMREIMRVTTK